MRYVIDGNNFLKNPRAGRGPGDFEDRKRAFIERLGRYASGRNVQITVVFDSRRPSLERICGVRVIHSEDADALILSEIPELLSGEVAVVSDDRQLSREAAVKGAKTLNVESFEFFLFKKLGPGRAPAAARREKPEPSEKDAAEWIKKYAARRGQRKPS